jgi:hypothetical protein
LIAATVVTTTPADVARRDGGSSAWDRVNHKLTI